MHKQHNEYYFLCLTTPDYQRVVKVKMKDLNKVVNCPRIGDPDIFSEMNSIPKEDAAVDIYNLHAKRKVKKFRDRKDSQRKLWKLLIEKAVEPEESDMRRSYQTKVDIPKPNNYCNVVTARDPYDTSQKLKRTDKVPMSAKNKERMEQYIGIKTIQDVLDKGVLNLNDIKYDIKLGYVKKG